MVCHTIIITLCFVNFRIQYLRDCCQTQFGWLHFGCHSIEHLSKWNGINDQKPQIPIILFSVIWWIQCRKFEKVTITCPFAQWMSEFHLFLANQINKLYRICHGNVYERFKNTREHCMNEHAWLVWLNWFYWCLKRNFNSYHFIHKCVKWIRKSEHSSRHRLIQEKKKKCEQNDIYVSLTMLNKCTRKTSVFAEPWIAFGRMYWLKCKIVSSEHQQ